MALTLKEKIITELSLTPGLTDTQLEILFAVRHQAVNKVCNELMAKGVIKRDKSSGVFRNYLTANISTEAQGRTLNTTPIIETNNAENTIHNQRIYESYKEILSIGELIFVETPFEIYEKNIPSPFLQYNAHTVREVLQKRQYTVALRKSVNEKHPQFLDANIQAYMAYLIENNDTLYRHFLNRDGEEYFCNFKLTDKSVYSKRGLYLYIYNDMISYIGRCRDSFNQRFNNNYGSISAVNCFKEGQSTNTYLNSLMNRYGDRIKVYLCFLSDINKIEETERLLRRQLRPVWNRQI